MLHIARRLQLPVVLHCRDNGDGTAAARALEILRGGFPDLKFHRHCFDGSLSELQAWQALPNIVFGITGKFMRRPGINSVIPRILPHQLVLETDAPFLSPVTCCDVNHPWTLVDIATAVSKLRNVPLKILTWQANDNAMRFYGIPKPDQGDMLNRGPRPR